MSSFEVTIQKIEVLPHPNADALELAKIGGYHAVIPKGKYQTGDDVIYIPEQAVLPEPLVSFLGLEGKLAGSQSNRVKPVRLRGELSQGLVMSLEDGDNYLGNSPGNFFSQSDDWGDLSELFGIEKWEPPIPTEMSGQVIYVNSIVKWSDVENIKKYPYMFEQGELVQVTEKIHGTCCGMTYDKKTDVFSVYSKGLSQQGLALERSETNIYWRAVEKYNLEAKLRYLSDYLGTSRIALFGEVYGQGVQDLGYGVDAKAEGPGFGAFDLWAEYVQTPNQPGHFAYPRHAVIWFNHVDIPTVPMLHPEMPYDYDTIAELASGKTTLDAGHIREGVVVKPLEGLSGLVDENGRVLRRIAKFVSEEYLTRKNGTEYN